MKHFSRSDFACKCGCGFDTVDYELIAILDAVRDHFDSPMFINSGCRCAAHNLREGGRPQTDTSRGSQHLYGRAADVRMPGVSPQLVAEAAAQYGARGIKAYSTFTHIDTRSGSEWHG